MRIKHIFIFTAFLSILYANPHLTYLDEYDDRTGGGTGILDALIIIGFFGYVIFKWITDYIKEEETKAKKEKNTKTNIMDTIIKIVVSVLEFIIFGIWELKVYYSSDSYNLFN